MNVGELFVNLGIKGSEKTIGALTSVKKGLGDIGSTSIEAKAAIFGMLYGLERLMAASGATGVNLLNFTAFTGQSAKELQQWQYAARQAGVSADELQGSVQGVFNSMANIRMGKGAPEGLALVAKYAGGVDSKKYQDTFYMMDKIQTAIQKMDPQMSAIVAKSFGLSQNVIAAMKQNSFNPEMLAKAPTLSVRQEKGLRASQVAFANLGAEVEMEMARFNAKHGAELAGQVKPIIEAMLKLGEAAVKLAEAVGAFHIVTSAIEGFTTVLNSLGDNGVLNTMKNIGEGLAELVTDTAETAGAGKLSGLSQKLLPNTAYAPPIQPSINGMIIPKIHLSNTQKQQAGHSTNIVQYITHHGDGKDTKPVADSHKKRISQAVRQSSAQRRDN